MSFRVLQFQMDGCAARLSLAGVAFALLLAGCASSSRDSEQVVEQPVTPRIASGQHVVSRGESISSIAMRYGWDWRELAARNGIAAPYVIHPGQRIQLGPARQGDTVQTVRQPAPAATVAPAAASTRQPAVATAPLKPAEGTTQAKPATTAPDARPAMSSRSPSGWAWPAEGPLVGRFSSNGSLNKGIDIGGQLGQPVVAASDGSVVYAGGGLRGYGELIIIKHSDIYVSAYGHNRRLLVREGQQVKAGQTIAEMGSTGTDRVKLHFEIRRQGKPVDPLQYLPSR
ncbi:LysM peptidoglycan-binding domain-containing protein [Azotobacter chroococcum subsp. isscasi]|uniref:peptidoglycan DD-metalloendopeptidase family protein n=1 Tax=Azotobacter chroococcum TaxID=353 RepID=UPI00103CAE43|nr:peptidoglycan DD-metalloendopeptidase family protein [Azotobacter chroococcum]TBW08248.1 LysM peptidoglycan-binding domain-containing protein [Azotobacter chroococcum subsp. isscasi]